MGNPKLIAMIPARIGSTRLKMKNLALINGRPMISYAIQAAQNADVFDRIILNSDHDLFRHIAERNGIEFYARPEQLGSSTTKSDDVVADFIDSYPCEAVAWVNTTSPLQPSEEIAQVVNHFWHEGFDSLITVKDEQVHCMYKGRPVNFDRDGLFAQTQDLTPVQPFVYSVMMWRTKPFMEAYRAHGHAFFCGKTGTYPVSKLSSVIIKREVDLMLADYILRTLERQQRVGIQYDPLVEKMEPRNG